jgi:hypothetical protein
VGVAAVVAGQRTLVERAVRDGAAGDRDVDAQRSTARLRDLVALRLADPSAGVGAQPACCAVGVEVVGGDDVADPGVVDRRLAPSCTTWAEDSSPPSRVRIV